LEPDVSKTLNGRCHNEVCFLSLLGKIKYFFVYSLKDLDEFIKNKDGHLANEVKEGDYNHLIQMMSNLGDVREKTQLFDTMFDPLRFKIDLLKSYGQEIPDDIYEKLQVIFKT
jgi:hypothetical protein